MARGRSGIVSNSRGFTYDFGIAIASNTARSLYQLTGTAIGLTTAIYGLSQITAEYTDTLKQNQLYYGSQLKTLKAMKFAQDQLLSGATTFATGDIMSGMRSLMSAGVDAQKNFKFMSDAASATGQSFTQFASSVQQAIAGNMSGLVEMGLLTERATRHFDRFHANSVNRQKVILNFIKNHKALNAAISNSFKTISGQWNRVMEGIRMFVQSIMGNPNDPNSLYSRISSLIGSIADFIHKHANAIRKVGAFIGVILGFIVKQVGSFIRFLGRQVEKMIGSLDMTTEDFAKRMYGLMVWLELWKVHIVKWARDHKEVIIGVFKAYLAFKAISFVAGTFMKIYAAASVLATVLRSLPRALHVFYRLMRFKLNTGLLLPIINGFRQIGAILGALPQALTIIYRYLRLAGVFSGGWLTTITRIVGMLLRAVPVWGWIIAALAIIWKYWDKIYPVVHDIVATVWNLGVMLVKRIWTGLKNVWAALQDVWQTMVDVWNVAKMVGKAILDFMPQALKDTITEYYNKIVGLWEKVKSIGTYVKNFFTKSADVTAVGAGDYGISSYATKQALSPEIVPSLNDNAPQDIKSGYTAQPGSDTGDPEMSAFGNPIAKPAPRESAYTKRTGDVSIQKGAVQINIAKGDTIDESKLARMLERILPELIRKTKLQAGY